MKYTRAEIVRMCEDAAREDITTFYTKGFVNYRGRVKGNPDLYYTELIAEFIINHIDKFEKMKCIDKEHCVKMYNLHHTGECNPMTDCLEARTAIDMYKKSRSGHDMKYVGEIIDYHVPIKTKMTRNAGRIDLLSVTDDAVYAITLKRDDCKDTMLKCVLEAYTHIKMVNKQKLLEDFNIPSSMRLYPALLVFKGGKQWMEMQEPKDHPHLLRLMKKLDIKGPFYVTTEMKYHVEK